MIPTLATLWASIKAAKMAITLAVIAVLVLFNIGQAVNTYANLRWEGPFGIVIGFEGWKPKAERRDREHKAFVKDVEAAQITARAAQQAAIDAEQARYDELAERTDRDDPPIRIAVADATGDYIRDNRMCPNAGSVASNPDSAPVSDDTGSIEAVPASGFVAVSDLDVQRCADANRYAITAHNFLMGLSVAK
jgi:hypothetical protein